jgi:DNA-directed RNA polymerase specialized sigma24 family protein
MSVEEIAAALQWPVAEVRFTLMSAIAKVRSQFHDL